MIHAAFAYAGWAPIAFWRRSCGGPVARVFDMRAEIRRGARGQGIYVVHAVGFEG